VSASNTTSWSAALAVAISQAPSSSVGQTASESSPASGICSEIQASLTTASARAAGRAGPATGAAAGGARLAQPASSRSAAAVLNEERRIMEHDYAHAMSPPSAPGTGLTAVSAATIAPS
jgi:hypothetical protein